LIHPWNRGIIVSIDDRKTKAFGEYDKPQDPVEQSVSTKKTILLK